MRTCDGRHPHAGRSRARPVSSPTLMSIIAVCSSLLAGCSESVEAPLEVEPQRAVVTTDREIQEIQDLFLGERDFVAIAATEPAFAGYYVEDQTLVAAVSDMTRETAVRGLVESSVPDLQSDRPPIVVPPTVLVQPSPEAWGEGRRVSGVSGRPDRAGSLPEPGAGSPESYEDGWCCTRAATVR